MNLFLNILIIEEIYEYSCQQHFGINRVSWLSISINICKKNINKQQCRTIIGQIIFVFINRENVYNIVPSTSLFVRARKEQIMHMYK